MEEVFIESLDHALLVEHCEVGEVRGHPIVNGEALDAQAENLTYLFVGLWQSLLFHQYFVPEGRYIVKLIVEANKIERVCNCKHRRRRVMNITVLTISHVLQVMNL